MGDLTHAMEDVFDRLRKNDLHVTPAVANTLFDGLDLLKTLMAEITSHGGPMHPPGDVTARLRSLVSDGSPVPAQPEGSEPPAFVHAALTEAAFVAAREARLARCSIYRLTIRLAADCVMRSLRALMVLQSVEQMGAVLATTPDEEAIEAERFGDEFGLVIATERSWSDIEHLVMSISEVVSAEAECIDAKVDGESYWDAASAVMSQPVSPFAIPHPATEEAAPTDGSPAGPASGDRASPHEILSAAAPGHNQTVRVDVVRLDNLLNLVGELVIDQTRIAEIAGRLSDGSGRADSLAGLHETAAHFGRITGEIQDEIMKARMLPIDC